MGRTQARRSAGDVRAMGTTAAAWISRQCSRQASPIDDLDCGRKCNPDLRCERPYLTSMARCDAKDRTTCVRHAHPLELKRSSCPCSAAQVSRLNAAQGERRQTK